MKLVKTKLHQGSFLVDKRCYCAYTQYREYSGSVIELRFARTCLKHINDSNKTIITYALNIYYHKKILLI